MGARGIVFKKRLLFLTLVILLFSQSTLTAADTEEETKNRLCEQWGLNLWGLSYHPNQDSKFSNINWGFGVRCYPQLEWKWFGKKENNNRIFFQADAMENSHHGLMIPISAGTEYTFKTFRNSCEFSLAGILTFAYYKNPADDTPEVKFGPIPEFSLGCNRIKANITFIPKLNKLPIAVITLSTTILIGSSRYH